MIQDNDYTKQLSIVINAKQVIKNVFYYISRDKNFDHFFSQIWDIAQIYDQMNDGSDKMKRFDFEKDLEQAHSILSHLVEAMQNVEYLKNKTSEDIAKCCNEFPDHTGKKLLMTLGHMPIINAVYEKYRYKEEVDKYVEPEEFDRYTEMYDGFMRRRRFAEDDYFVDYERRNEYIERLKKEYEREGGRLEVLNESITQLCNMRNKSEYGPQTLLGIGSAYWDNLREEKSNQAEAFKRVIKAMSDALGKGESG